MNGLSFSPMAHPKPSTTHEQQGAASCPQQAWRDATLRQCWRQSEDAKSNDYPISEIEHLFEKMDPRTPLELALFLDKPGLLPNPGLLPSKAKFVQDAMKRAPRRIKMLADELVSQHRDIPFRRMPDHGGEGG
jgi:hypothetical protein